MKKFDSMKVAYKHLMHFVRLHNRVVPDHREFITFDGKRYGFDRYKIYSLKERQDA